MNSPIPDPSRPPSFSRQPPEVPPRPTGSDDAGSEAFALEPAADDAEGNTTLLSPNEERRLQAIGRLSASIAHDFNNLLTVILSFSEELEAGLEDPEQRDQAADIRDAAQRGAVLVRQLLTYGQQDDRYELIELNSELISLVSLLRRALGPAITLETNLGAAIPMIALAPGQVEQILVNLATNARDAMPGGGRVEVATDLVSITGDGVLGTGWHVRLRVKDYGKGIPVEVLERVLEPFFTTKEEEAGTGLGLATVYEICRDAGGDLRIERCEPHGTEVTVLLPAYSAEGDALALAPTID